MVRRRYSLEEKQAVLEAIPDHPSKALSSSRISVITGIPAMNVTSIIKRYYLPRKVHRFKHPQSNNWLYFKVPTVRLSRNKKRTSEVEALGKSHTQNR